MTLDTVLAIIFGLLDVILIVYQWKERNRIKAKEQIWYRDTQSIVNIAAKMQKRIDNNEIQNVKELRSTIEGIGAFSNGIHISIKEELKIRD
jgi:hypothetical protein